MSSTSEEEVEYKHLDLAELIGTPPTRTQSRRLQGALEHLWNPFYICAVAMALSLINVCARNCR